jgi:glycosyltransferase involved in cell wall biosynthesis
VTSAQSNGDALSRHEVQRLLDAAAGAVGRGDPEGAIELLARVPIADCRPGQLGKAARVAKRAGALELWISAGQLCLERSPTSPEGYLALLADLGPGDSDPALQAMALEVATSGLEILRSEQLTSAPVAFHVNRAIQRFSSDADLRTLSRNVANGVFAAAEDAAVWLDREEKRRQTAARELLDLAAATVDRGDPRAAIEILANVSLGDCGDAQLAKAARVARRAGAIEMSVSVAQLCLKRSPSSPEGYLALLGDLDLLLDHPELQPMALEVATTALEALRNEELTSAAVAFHVNRVIQRFGDDPGLKNLSQEAANGRFAAAEDGAIWHARDLIRRGALDRAAEVLESAAADGHWSDEAVVVRGRIALAAGRWGRDWAHLKALEDLGAGNAGGLREDLGHVRALFAELGQSFDAGPTTPEFAAIASPESAAEVICRGSRRQPTRQPSGLVMAGGSLAAGGAERLMAICFREFRRRGVLGGVDLALPELPPRRGHDDPLFFLPLTGVTESELVQLPPPGPATRPFAYLPGGMGRRTQSWYQLFSAQPPRAVHAWLDYSMICAGLAGLWAGVPKIILHSLNMRPQAFFDAGDAEGGQWQERGRGWKEIYAQLLSRSEVHFVNCSEVATRDYLDWIGLDESSVNAHTVYSGLDLAPFDEDGSAMAAELRASLGIPERAPVVGTAFRFTPVKQPEHWVEAAIRIRQAVPDAHFVMFGDGVERKPLMDKIEAAGASAYIHCPGRFDDIHLRLQLLDVFMLSSRSEGLPNVLVEAQACGVPVVAYDVGGVRETFVEGITGELVRDNNPTALAAAVVGVLQNREWRRAAGDEGRKFVRREFTIDQMADTLERLISD